MSSSISKSAKGTVSLSAMESMSRSTYISKTGSVSMKNSMSSTGFASSSASSTYINSDTPEISPTIPPSASSSISASLSSIASLSKSNILTSSASPLATKTTYFSITVTTSSTPTATGPYGGDIAVLRSGGEVSYLDGFLQRAWIDVYSAECTNGSCVPRYTFDLPYSPGTYANASSLNIPAFSVRDPTEIGHASISNLGDGSLRISMLGYTQCSE